MIHIIIVVVQRGPDGGKRVIFNFSISVFLPSIVFGVHVHVYCTVFVLFVVLHVQY